MGGGGGRGCLYDARMAALRNVVYHRAWKLIILACIILLLVGPSVHTIWMPKSSDMGVLIVLICSIAILVVDLIIRCIVDESYFLLRDRESLRAAKCGRMTRLLHVGSFAFWFDLASIAPVILMITYALSPNHTTFLVDLPFGPVFNSFEWFDSFGWFSYTIGTFALMARFIRSFTLRATSRNWNFHYLDPFYWMNRLISTRGSESRDDVVARDGKFGNDDRQGKHKLHPSQTSQPSSSMGVDDTIPSRRQVSAPSVLGTDPPKRYFNAFMTKESIDGASARTSLFLGNSVSSGSPSQVGTAMRELTGQRVALGALVAVFLSTVLDWRERDTTAISTMMFLHGQTANENIRTMAVDIAHSTVIPFLFNYTRANSSGIIFQKIFYDVDYISCRDRHIMTIIVQGQGVNTTGHFDMSQAWIDEAKINLAITLTVLLLWVVAETSFGRPVIHLVVEPIERMVRLLSMLMKDPLGYSDSPDYRNLVREGDGTADGWYWTKEMLRGMETHFLMSTIQRIGNLLRVGFGSAGAEIIRDNLERCGKEDVLFLNKKGGTVSCIFLFCDIRQFTDATESLQEEVFVFTNRIANVVHSICNSYGGAANKNIGDAFLVSWRLDDAPVEEEVHVDPFRNHSNYQSSSNQADKALLSVVKISMALHYDQYFTDGMSEAAKKRLVTKLSNRKGPLVQMGFGLHAGTAVQGAIGSQRKLDATYISESVERAEFLESSTKTYGLPILMSDSFYNLLSPANRRRCRKVDQLLLLNEGDRNLSDPHDILDNGERMNIYTFDMDIDALWRSAIDVDHNFNTSDSSDAGAVRSTARRKSSNLMRSLDFSKSSDTRLSSVRGGDIEKAIQAAAATVEQAADRAGDLVLPNGMHHYSEKSWHESDIKKIRREYVSSGIIFPKYQEGLKAYYTKDWEYAKKCFELVLTQREDGPSCHFLNLIVEHGGVPPKNFIGYSVERG